MHRLLEGYLRLPAGVLSETPGVGYLQIGVEGTESFRFDFDLDFVPAR